ncbi:MAG: hypothetical protein EPN57_20420 [Paraburkholderia sp.]|nr:MAG: hypothetical protein EPN57_20420 [Paraburkholderia sp.]
MASIEKILQTIVDHPGFTAAEIGDELDMTAEDVQSRLKSYIDAGRVKRDKKKSEGSGRDVFIYFPAQSLVDASDGRIVLLSRAPRTPRTIATADESSTNEARCHFGFFSNGQVTVSKGSKEIKLSREETSRLLEFLDSINVERAVGA